MLCIYLVQQWHGLAAEALEDAICDSQQALRNFVGIDLWREYWRYLQLASLM